MDRAITYVGALPAAKDVLTLGQYTMTALAKACEAVFGTASFVDAFTCTPTTPASLNAILTPGIVLQTENLEASIISALTQDTSHSILKMGKLMDPVTLAITPPGTVGYSQVYLIEVQYQDDDSTTQVLNYYNATTPSSPFYGPPVGGTGSGQPQTTVRKGKAAYQIKAGTAATTGTQLTPSADAGWTGLFTVTVANGQTTITSGNIGVLSTAPFLTTNGKLPRIPYGVQNGDWISVNDIGTANNLVVTPVPGPTAYVKGMMLEVWVANRNTGAVVINVNSLGNVSVVRRDGTALQAGDLLAGAPCLVFYDGTSFRLASFGGAEVPRWVPGSILYVRTDGSDNNDGSANTSAKAKATINGAVTQAVQNFVLGNKTLTIQLGIPGTYAAFDVPATLGEIVIQGDTAAQDSYVIQTSSTDSAGSISQGANVSLTGLQLYNAGQAVSHTLQVNYGATCTLSYVSFNGVLLTGSAHIAAQYGGSVVANNLAGGTIKFMSGMADCLYANDGNITFPNGSSLTMVGTPAFTDAFARATVLGGIWISSVGGTVNGAATGSRYKADLNSIINTSGSGASYLPGNSAGSTSSGGQYV